MAETRKNAKKNMSAQNNRRKKGENTENTAKHKEKIYDSTVYDAIKLLVLLTVSILLLISLIGMGGFIGDKIAWLFFGLFGILAYLIPFGLFLLSFYYIRNRGKMMAVIRIICCILMPVAIMGILELISTNIASEYKLLDLLRLSGEGKIAGGLIGYEIASKLTVLIGRAGAIVVLVCIILILFLLLAGKPIYHEIAGMINQERKKRVRDFKERRELQKEQASERNIKRSDRFEKQEKPEMTQRQDRSEKQEPLARQEETEEREVKLEENSTVSKESKVLKPEPQSLEQYDSGVKLKPLVSIPSFMQGNQRSDRSHKYTMNRSVDNQSFQIQTQADKVLSEDEMLEEDFDDVIEALSLDQFDDEDIPPLSNVQEKDIVEVVSEQEAELPAKKTKKENVKVDENTTVDIVTEDSNQELPYIFPPYELLEQGKGAAKTSAAALRETALKLQKTCQSFGVGVQVTNVSCGPSVTRYELQPNQGVKVSRIVSLADDIKLNLAVADIRIEAPIPGKAAVGIEVPNRTKEMVRLRDLLETSDIQNHKSRLAFAAGKDIGGQTVVADIEKMPHLLIAGATGSGKSVCINTIIMSILYRADPKDVKMIMIDPKVVELNIYNGLPHLLIPVVTDPKKAAGALNWAVATMMERYKMFADLGAKDIKSYNARIEHAAVQSSQLQKLPQIVIIIDELADLMMVAQSEVEDAICRLAQLARAAGIHLIIATQRPSVNVITGLIKANVPSRIAFAVSSGVDSRTILDMNGAEKLLGNGDMLFAPAGAPKPMRVQGAFVSEEEITRVTDFIRANSNQTVVYSQEITEHMNQVVLTESQSESDDERDVYFEAAARLVIEKEKASIGMLQRNYRIGFNRAARIMDQLYMAGIVGQDLGTKPRQVTMTLSEFENYLRDNQ